MVDIDTFAKRFREESHVIGDNPSDIARKLGCTPRVVRDWLQGSHFPSAFYIGLLYECGMDVIYLLVGERTR